MALASDVFRRALVCMLVYRGCYICLLCEVGVLHVVQEPNAKCHCQSFRVFNLCLLLAVFNQDMQPPA